MAMSEQQEHRSPPLETARASSNPYEPQLPRSGPMTGGSAATSMVTAGDMAGGGAGGEVERGLEGHQDNVRRSSSPWAALLSLVSPYNRVSISSLIASPGFQRKRRSHVPRAAVPSHKWAGVKIPVIPPAPAKKTDRRKRNSKETKKRDTPCVLCGAPETPLWRTWPTDRRVALCNACGIQVRTPGVVLPELVYLPHPVTATATKAVISELELPVPPLPQEIQPVIVSDSPRAVLPSQVRVNLPPPAMPKSWVTSSAMASSATTTVVPEVQQPRPQAEIQESESPSPPDSPILEHMLDTEVYLVKRTVPRREKSPPLPPPPTPPTAEPEPAAAVPAPGNEEDKRTERLCRHCLITWTQQWRTGPLGEGTLCNACGVSYKKGRLVPEYRPKASPTFNEAEHSNMHSVVLEIRRMQDDPAPPPPYLPVKPRMKRRKNKGQQQQPAQARKKQNKGNNSNSNKEQNQQPAPAQPAAVAVVHQVHDDDDEQLPPEPALMKLRKQPRPRPAAAQPRVVGDGMVQQQHLPPPPPPPPELPQADADNDVDLMARLQDLQPLPPAQPRDDGDDLVMGPPDPFLLDGPSAPMIIVEDYKPRRVVIVIDDD